MVVIVVRDSSVQRVTVSRNLRAAGTSNARRDTASGKVDCFKYDVCEAPGRSVPAAIDARLMMRCPDRDEEMTVI